MKTPEWKMYEIEKPPMGEEVLAYHKDWMHVDSNSKGIRIGFLRR